ncbi:hypothetical protein L4D09_08765 [Photobacterium makurazakiensis]|uniref:hypothetical protein n=1 Tax=Photobacterium makurazakiensis TaxID=2910234 RepID=UPI003D0E7620
MVDEIAEIATQIATATEDLGTVSVEISNNVHQISFSFSQHLDQIEAMEQAANSLKPKLRC